MLKKLQWSNRPVKVLGIFIDEDSEVMQRANLETVFAKAKGIIKIWKIRDLMLLGSILVVNSLIASLFVY